MLAADVAGYSRMMGTDEEATMAAWWGSRQEVIDPAVVEHRGRIVKLTGDGFLAEFPSVLDAVRCAVAMQTELAGRNAALSDAQRMDFRMGVNLCDIIADDEDIYGDGVNIAARLESLARPGGIVVSGIVHEDVIGKLDLAFEDMGEQTVKNITRPVRAYHVLLDGTAPAAAESVTSTANGGKPSIAVLPFDNMSGDRDQEFFADGITEDIITDLSRFQELSVVARNSVFTYKNQPTTAQQVGRDLGVRYILEGSVRRAGNRVRVTAQLIDAATGHHLWAERFDRDLEDVFAVQDEVTARIVATLAGKIQTTERRRARDLDRTENLQAYELVLRGRELWLRFTAEDNLEARRLYERAIELDPDYARAYASVAWTYLMAFDHHWSEDAADTLDRALEFAQRGVKVNPASHSNFLTLGQVHLWSGRHDSAIDAFERGIAINPNDSDGYIFLAQAVCYRGDSERGVELMEKAFTINPDTAAWQRAFLVMVYFNGRRYEDAVATMDRIENPPTLAFRWYIAALAHLGRDAEARAAAGEYRRRNPDFILARHLSRVHFHKPEDKEHYAEGLRLAGLS